MRDSGTIRFQTRLLNQHLVCTLCMGYFADATTIIECLHTFCRDCILQHFHEAHTCPQCGNRTRPMKRCDELTCFKCKLVMRPDGSVDRE